MPDEIDRNIALAKDAGLCAAPNPDRTALCAFSLGHEGGHGWEYDARRGDTPTLWQMLEEYGHDPVAVMERRLGDIAQPREVAISGTIEHSVGMPVAEITLIVPRISIR